MIWEIKTWITVNILEIFFDLLCMHVCTHTCQCIYAYIIHRMKALKSAKRLFLDCVIISHLKTFFFLFCVVATFLSEHILLSSYEKQYFLNIKCQCKSSFFLVTKFSIYRDNSINILKLFSLWGNSRWTKRILKFSIYLKWSQHGKWCYNTSAIFTKDLHRKSWW